MYKLAPIALTAALGVAGVAQSVPAEAHPYVSVGIGFPGVAFVVPASDADLDGLSIDALRAWCRARLADYKAPDRVVVVDDLPITAMLKIDKRALSERAAADQGATP